MYFPSSVGAATDDFEQYILENMPLAQITKNSKENPKFMNNVKDTYSELCEVRRGMTDWNKNFNRCPKSLFDL